MYIIYVNFWASLIKATVSARVLRGLYACHWEQRSPGFKGWGTQAKYVGYTILA